MLALLVDMLSEAGMKGLYNLVSRTWKPLQEVAWASIGNILTAIEIRQAYSNNILTPWKNWQPETPKKASTMRKADRGGFIFNPRPEVYEDVHDLAEVLNQKDVAVRAGNHCAQPQHQDLDLAGTVRASPYLYNTEEDVEKLLEAVREAQNIF
ncbi:DNA polymerase I [Candidatus Haloredivivus sp. G17]|nr:DNA polymerase I [Candidatus Haloredivivus sp. G17]